MTIAAITASKPNEIITVGPDHSLQDAVTVLERHGIGAVIVDPGDGTIAGILSERDIVRAVSRAGAAALEHKVSRYMTADVVTCTKHDTVATVLGLMTKGKFRHMPVAEGDKYVSIISIGDLVKFRLAEAELEAASMRDYIATG